MSKRDSNEAFCASFYISFFRLQQKKRNANELGISNDCYFFSKVKISKKPCVESSIMCLPLTERRQPNALDIVRPYARTTVYPLDCHDETPYNRKLCYQPSALRRVTNPHSCYSWRPLPKALMQLISHHSCVYSIECGIIRIMWQW